MLRQFGLIRESEVAMKGDAANGNALKGNRSWFVVLLRHAVDRCPSSCLNAAAAAALLLSSQALLVPA